jgi:3,4-dihydroxy 2-butanone 4-phosphate synthase/GTP cyclohydrolase II
MVIMVDDEDRENEGDLVFAASAVCPEKINFMTKEARGLVCLALDQAGTDRLKLPMMEDAGRQGGHKSTAFTVSIEARHGVTTGISAADRAQTIRVACDANSKPEDIVVPGHIFPLRARPGGVLERAGHTEGSVDLARLAGLPPAAVICEIMNDDGSMARLGDLQAFGARHDIPIVTIADLITFRLMKESLIEKIADKPVSTAHGTFRGVMFRSLVDGLQHLALVKGSDEAFEPGTVVDVRVHRQRQLLDVLSHPEKDGRCRIEYGLKMLRDSDAGVMLYLTRDDDNLLEEFATWSQTQTERNAVSKRPWVEMDERSLGIGAQILRALGVHRMRVHMSQPNPLKGLVGFDLEVVDTQAINPAHHLGS